MVCVQYQHLHATVCRPPNRLAQPYLVLPTEQIFVVFDESVVVMLNRIRRIHKHEVTRLRCVDILFEIPYVELCALEKRGEGLKAVNIKQDIRLGTDGHIELALEIDTVQSVPAGSI